MRTLLLRLISVGVILFAIFAGTRALVRALPGDPLETLIAESGTSIPAETLRAEMGLDRAFLPALKEDLGRFLRGDFGVSLLSREPIAPLIKIRFLRTLELTLLSLSLGLLLSIAIGLPAAAAPNSAIDQLCSWHGAISAALPTPWIGPVLMVLFAVWIPVLPTGGSVILPSFTLAFAFSGLWARLIRERVRETLLYGAAPGARARGLPEWRVLLKYGLAPSSGALLAYLGTQFGGLLAGAFVTEVIFDWRGMGSLTIEAVLKRDYPVVEATVFVAAAASFLGTFIGDCLQKASDPRARALE